MRLVARNNLPRQPVARRPAHGWAWLALALILFGLQTLGLVHRIVHAPSADTVASHAQAELRSDGERSDWGAALFPAHGDDSGCRLYDGLGHQVFALPAALVVALILPATAHLRGLAGEFVARRAALFEARGPPLSR
jgi:hypothetical protein